MVLRVCVHGEKGRSSDDDDVPRICWIGSHCLGGDLHDHGCGVFWAVVYDAVSGRPRCEVLEHALPLLFGPMLAASRAVQAAGSGSDGLSQPLTERFGAWWFDVPAGKFGKQSPPQLGFQGDF